MARWQPAAPERLLVAALELFEECGYDNTTVNEIAQRAGLTKSTFFRHFADKREVLFSGNSFVDLLTEQMAAAPAEATPLQTVAHAYDALGQQVFTPARRDFVARRANVVAANPELQEREALKEFTLREAMAEVLRQRGVHDLAARVAAQLGVLTLTVALECWSNATSTSDFSEVARRTLHELRAASASC